MKQRFLFAVILAVLFVGIVRVGLPVEHAYAQGISGDALCGGSSNPCTPAHFKILANRLFLLFASVGTALLFLFIIGRIIYSAYLYMANGDPGALARARTQSFNMMIGYGIIIAVFGGMYLIGLRIFGVKSEFLNLLQFFSFDGFIEHAYAQTGTTLPNPLSSDNAYDIIIAGISLAMKFFIYPALITMWVASGFKLVYSQGNPEGLKTARKWFLVSFVVTVIAFTLQGFIIAFRGTAMKVFGSASTQTVSPGSSSLTPSSSQPVTSCINQPINTVCTVAGRNGRCGYSDPSQSGSYGCYVEPAGGTSPFAVQRVTDCTGKPVNTVCTVGGRDGLCGTSEGGSYGCYVGTCSGQIGLDGVCYSR